MANKLRTRRGDDKEPMSGKAAPYKRPARAEPDPTKPEIIETLKDCTDLGQCGQALKQAFPDSTQEWRLAELRQYLINKQYRWESDTARLARAARARRSGAPFVAPDGEIDSEQIIDELAAAKGEIEQLQRDNCELEEERDAFADQLEALTPASKAGG